MIPNGDSDSLLIKAREMDVDVLLWGGTHRFEAYEMEGKFFVNPGSATGAMYMGWVADEEPVPSFCLMDVSRPVALRIRCASRVSGLIVLFSRSKEIHSCSMSTDWSRKLTGLANTV